MSYGYWGMHTVGYNGCVLQIQANKGCIWRNLWTRTALVCPLWCIWPRNTHFATLYGISFHWGYIGYCCRKYVWEHIKELYHKPLCICVCERETGLQLNQSCLCACSLNPLSVKTQFVWELKETGELLKLAEASLIENQQTTETPQHTHTLRGQSNVIPTGYHTHNRYTWRMLTAHAEQSWWISVFATADGLL